MMRAMPSLKAIAHNLRIEAHVAWLTARDPAVSLFARLFGLLIAAYALSPIDLIPDFIPVLGQLDELVLVPLGVALAIRLTPPHVWQQCLHEAEHRTEPLPRLVWGALLIIGIWLVVVGAFLVWLIRLVS